MKNIYRRHFRIFIIESFERRTRNLFLFVDFNETRIWFDEWAINKTRFKKFVKTFQIIVSYFISISNDSIIENSSIFIEILNFTNNSSINDSSTITIESSTFVNNSSIFIKNSTITKKISRDDMIFNLFNFDFFDTQRLKFAQIIVATLRRNIFKSSFNSFNFLNSSNDDNNDNNNNEKWKSNDIEYFDSKFEKSINTNNSIINFDWYIFYRNVYVFVDRLKNLISLRDENKFRIVIS